MTAIGPPVLRGMALPRSTAAALRSRHPRARRPRVAALSPVGDGRDDDVVARQIREAAMKERDPAIREKLWEEYRRYKGIRKGES